MKKRTVEEVKEDLSLSTLEGGKLDIDQIIFRLNDRFNQEITKRDLSQPTNYNVFSAGIRLIQSNLSSRYNEENKIILSYLEEEAKQNTDINEKIRLQFRRLDTILQIRDRHLIETNYATLEDTTPGALSQFIAQRINEKDSNFILMICGQPRSGKSKGAIRIAFNVGLLTNRAFTQEDIVYTHSQWLQRKEVRRSRKELKGSAQQIDEGQAMDAQNWFDTEVKEIVNHLRTQGADNTLTIIVSPLFPDIAAKARGLVHAVMYPWKTWGKKYVELTDTGNIDYERNISSWKLDFLDLDPMTGKTYPGKLKAALGDIIKVDLRLPEKDILKKYEVKSRKYKLQLQKDQLHRITRKRLKENDPTVYQELANQILEQIDTYKKGKDGNINMRTIGRRLGIGRVYAEKVHDAVIEALKKDEKQKLKTMVTREETTNTKPDELPPQPDNKPTN